MVWLAANVDPIDVEEKLGVLLDLDGMPPEAEGLRTFKNGFNQTDV
jgi:hypothetical protein